MFQASLSCGQGSQRQDWARGGLRWLRERVGSISAMFVELSCGKGAESELGAWRLAMVAWPGRVISAVAGRECQTSKTIWWREGSNVFQAAPLMFVELIGFQAVAAERQDKLERAGACEQVEASLLILVVVGGETTWGPKEKQRRSRQCPSYDVLWCNMMGLNLEPIWNILQFIFFQKGPGTKSNWMQNPDFARNR